MVIAEFQQSIERQIRNIKAVYPAAVISQEAYTGTKFDGRKEWNKIYKKAKEGDTIVFDSVSRMSRDADEGFQLYEELYSCLKYHLVYWLMCSEEIKCW